VSSAADLLRLADEVERLLVQGYSDQAIKRELGLHRHKAGRLVHMVRQRWQREGALVPREQKRAQMLQMILDLYRKCLDNETAVPYYVGPGTQDIKMVKAPDLKAAGRILELLCKFEGLLEQPDAPGQMNVTILQHIQSVLGITEQPDALPPNVVEMPPDE